MNNNLSLNLPLKRDRLSLKREGLTKPELKSPSLLGERDLGGEVESPRGIKEFNAAISNFGSLFTLNRIGFLYLN
jgi:hypothetical protein